MYDAGPDITETHLPERWAVLEQALRQMSVESGAHYPGDLPDEAGLSEAEPVA